MKSKIVLGILIFFMFFGVIKASKAPVDVTKLSVEELSDALDKGYLTSELLVNLYLERIEEYDKQFNSINQINSKALDEAKELDKERKNGKVRGILHGIPILVKTNINVMGLATTGGAKALLDNNPKEDAFAIQRLKDAGAIILGSTNMSELAFSAKNSYSSFGYVRNVFDTDYTSYGSSGGSAVAVAASFAAAALGTDTNSSVRVPASAAGLVGIRPTIGTVSRYGVIPYDIERDTIGVLSRTVKDNALILSVISAEDKNDSVTKGVESKNYKKVDKNLSGVTIGVINNYVKGIENPSVLANGLTDLEVYKLAEIAINDLEKSGAKIVYIDKLITAKYYNIATSTYAGITMCDNFNDYIKTTTGKIRSFQALASSSGHVQNLDGYVVGCDGNYKSKAERDEKKKEYRDYVEGIFKEYDLDVILYPSVKSKTFKYNATGLVSPGSSLGSVINYPSITVPMGNTSAGFAYGIEFLAQSYNEDILYKVGYGYENVRSSKLVGTSLAPGLYEIPSEVQDLKKLYEKALTSKLYGKLVSETKEYFLNYNNNENYIEDAKVLIEKYDKLKVEVVTGNSKRIILIIVVIVLLLIFLKVFKKIKRLYRNFRINIRRMRKKKKSKRR